MRRSIPIPLLVVLVCLAVLPLAATGADASSGHRWPVTPGIVTQRFDQPLHPWSPGHRGVDLHVDQDSVVRASHGGRVAFAGTVVDRTWITIDHGGDLRTTVGPMATVEVEPGQWLARGARLGRPVLDDPGHRGLHWSARRGGEYLDPLSLLGVVVPTLVGPGGWEPSSIDDLPGYEPWDGRDRTLGLLPSSPIATGPGWLSPPNGNDVIGVAGVLTQTGSTALPLEWLGYDAGDVTHLSHAGRDPAILPGGGLDQLPYGAADTFEGVHRSALLLREQLRAQWAAEPGVAVDLVGHSFGGVVVLHYLLALHDPADPALPPIGHVVTIASPLEGADGASAALRDNPPGVGLPLLDAAVGIAEAVLGVGPDPPTIEDLAVESPLLRELAAAWQEALADPWSSPLATGTQVLTIGGSRDVIVPEHRSDLPGADHVTVPGGHTAAHESEAVLQVVRAFLAGEEVPGAAGGWGAWLSGGISLAEQLVGVAL